jgi:hypothetical protein
MRSAERRREEAPILLVGTVKRLATNRVWNKAGQGEASSDRECEARATEGRIRRVDNNRSLERNDCDPRAEFVRWATADGEKKCDAD